MFLGFEVSGSVWRKCHIRSAPPLFDRRLTRRNHATPNWSSSEVEGFFAPHSTHPIKNSIYVLFSRSLHRYFLFYSFFCLEPKRPKIHDASNYLSVV